MSELNNSVIKAMTILELFSKKEELSVIELQDLTGFSSSAINRIISSFESMNYVYKSEISGKYLLGSKLYFLGESTRIYTHLVDKSKTPIVQLSKNLLLAISLSVIEDLMSIVIYQRKSETIMGMLPTIGSRRALNCSASGKVMIAFSKDPMQIVEDMTYHRYTENTIIDKDKYIEVIKETSKNGYACDDQELEKDLFCIAVPIIDISGYAVCSLSVSGYKSRVVEDFDNILSELKKTLNIISNLLK